MQIVEQHAALPLQVAAIVKATTSHLLRQKQQQQQQQQQAVNQTSRTSQLSRMSRVNQHVAHKMTAIAKSAKRLDLYYY